MIEEKGGANAQPPSPEAIRFVLWVVAIDPILLAFIAYVLKIIHAMRPLSNTVTGPLTVIFAIASLCLVYVSFLFASGKYDPKGVPLDTTTPVGVTRFDSIRIVSAGLAAAPAILGFVLHLLTGDDWALLAFNGAALLVAVRHVMAFNAADGGQ